MKDIERPWRRLAERQHGAVSRTQLLSSGLTRRQVEGRNASGALDRACRGVYRVAGTPASFEQRVMVACLASGGAASHRCAAALWQLRRCSPGMVEVTVTNRHVPTLPAAMWHSSDRLRAVDLTAIGAIPVTTPARTLLDLGAVAPPRVVESAVEDALLRRLVSYDWLERTVARLGGPGRNGSGVLREILASRPAHAAPTESTLEDELVALLRQARLPPPTRQHWIRVDGHPPVRLDVSYPEVRLALEAQSVTWHTGAEELQSDCDKRNLLLALGWRLLVFTWADIHRRPGSVVAAVRRALSCD